MKINFKSFQNIIVISAFVFFSLILLEISSYQFFWLDELTSIWFSNSSISETLTKMQARNDPHPPGFQILLSINLNLFKTESFVVPRILSIASGLLSYLFGVLYAYKLNPRYFFQLFILFTFSFWVSKDQIYYSTEVRSYQLTVFLVAVFIYLYRFNISKYKNYYLLITSFLLSVVSYIGTILVISIFLVLTLESRFQFKNLLFLLVGPITASIYYSMTISQNPNTRRLQYADPINHLKEIAFKSIYEFRNFRVITFVIIFFSIYLIFQKFNIKGFKDIYTIFKNTGIIYFLVCFFLVQIISMVYPIYQMKNFHFLKFMYCLFLIEMFNIILIRNKIIAYSGLFFVIFLGQSILTTLYSQNIDNELKYGQNFYPEYIDENIPLLVINDDIAIKSRIQANYLKISPSNIYYLNEIYSEEIIKKENVNKLKHDSLIDNKYEKVQILGVHSAIKQISEIESLLNNNGYTCDTKIEIGTNIFKLCER